MMRNFALMMILALQSFAQAPVPLAAEPRTAEEFYTRAQQNLVDKQMDKVVEDCTQAILQDPDYLEALMMRATAYSNLKQYDRAIGDLDTVLKMHPRATTFTFRGNQHMMLKKYAEAAADFSEAIRRLPTGSAAYELRANAKLRLGDAQGAAEDRAKARELAGLAKPAVPADSKQQQSPFKIGGPVSAPKVLSQKEPIYTEAARAAKMQGAVVLTLVVDEEGAPRDFQVTRALGYGLDEKAIEAVQQWRFRPGMKDGKPVAVIATIEVNFRLL